MSASPHQIDSSTVSGTDAAPAKRGISLIGLIALVISSAICSAAARS